MDWLETMVRSVIDKLGYYINDRGMTFEEAEAAVREKSTAGPAVWAEAKKRITGGNK